MIAEVLSGVVVGVECSLARVEVSVSDGLPSLSIVGLAQGAVREGRDRVRAALQAAGVRLPPRRITVGLSPADVEKRGSGFDLPIAVALLAAAGYVAPEAVRGRAFVGELGLDGEIRPVRGVLPLAAACRAGGARSLVVPRGNAREAAAGAGGLAVLGADNLREVVLDLAGELPLDRESLDLDGILGPGSPTGPDLAEVSGHAGPKRALEVAAAGGHNLLLLGPPGSGKTMLARRLPGILPPLALEEALEVTTIHSVAGLLRPGEALVRERPFRAPHHTISRSGLVGGGSPVRPGEVSLAHRGVLFLDELPEFPRSVLETLRQPVEDGRVSIVRARESVRFPSRFTLVAAMNPCPCGYLGDPRRACTCDPSQVSLYRSRISGPLRDRIDLHVEVPTLPSDDLLGGAPAEPSRLVAERVRRARARQVARFSRGSEGEGRASARTNAALDSAGVRRWCRTEGEARRLLDDACDRLALSPRGIHKVLKVARTIADLDGADPIGEAHVAEAVQYREIAGPAMR